MYFSTIIIWGMVALVTVNLVLRLLWMTSVRGTHRRYVYAGWYRITVHLTPLGWLIWAGHSLHEGRYILVAVDLLCCLTEVWQLKVFYDSDDDDWWKGMKKKLRRKIRTVVQKMRTTPPVVAPSPA